MRLILQYCAIDILPKLYTTNCISVQAKFGQTVLKGSYFVTHGMS